MEIYTEKILGSGNFKKVKDNDQLLYQIKRFLNIQEGTYPNDPNYGINFKQFNFELINDRLLNSVKNNIQNKLKTYFPSFVRVSNINIGKIRNGIQIIIQLNIKGNFSEIQIDKLEDELK